MNKLVIALVAGFVSCSKSSIPWAQYCSNIHNNSCSRAKIDDHYFTKHDTTHVLIGFDSYRYAETRSILLLEQAVDSSSMLNGTGQQLMTVKIVGDFKNGPIGVVYHHDNKLSFYLNLSRFYSRSLYEQPLLIASTDGEYFFTIPVIQTGFNLDCFRYQQTKINRNQLQLFLNIAAGLAANEINILSNDEKKKQITHEESDDYKTLLSRLLAAPSN